MIEQLIASILELFDYTELLENRLEQAILSDITSRNPGIDIEKVKLDRVRQGTSYFNRSETNTHRTKIFGNLGVVGPPKANRDR